MSALRLDADTERVATNLLRFVEWSDRAFSLIFLFADIGSARALADWLDERLSLSGAELQRVAPAPSFSTDPEAFVDTVVNQLASWNGLPGAVWLELHLDPGEPKTNDARMRFLARLNERRYLLERDLKHPLVLVLPAESRVQARTIAPDLWHVRALSEQLVATQAGRLIEASIEEIAHAEDASVAAVIVASSDEPAEVVEWFRIRGTEPTRINLPSGWAAVRALLASGRLAAAAVTAQEVLAVARERAGHGSRTEALRDMTISLSTGGDVARAQGDGSQAEAMFREGLALSRQLVERLGGTPEALRDLSVSLSNVGGVARAQGDGSQAEAVYRESLALSRQLVERLGGTPGALEDLAISLLNVAAVPPETASLRAEALQIYETLAGRFPEVERYAERVAALRGNNLNPSTNEPVPAP